MAKSMSFLARDDAPFDNELWKNVDETIVKAAREMLVGRRFLPLYGPLGPGVRTATIDSLGREEKMEDGFAVFEGRRTVQLPQLYEDFWLYWRDLQAAESEGRPADLSAAYMAAQELARREDEMVFYGVPSLGIEGLLTAKGVNTQKRGDWSSGETSFTDIATAIATLQQNGRFNKFTLVVSQDLFVQLQRIQSGTGVMESERINRLVEGRMFVPTVLKPKTALLLSAQPQYMDLMVGVDFATAYTEAVDLNHHLRVLETALPRIKAPDAIVVFK